MFDASIELLAARVRQITSTDKLPVDLKAIANYDDIVMAPVKNHERFNGKIEFLADENTFVIYHPDPSTYRYPNRLRFSIGHELGHFHIDEHREALVRGEYHSSISGFKSKDPKELQADEFAAALLIPARTMEPKIEKRGFMTLEEIRTVAIECEVSLYATTIRYVRMASEPCGVALAKNGQIISFFASDEARFRRFGKLSITQLPMSSLDRVSSGATLSNEIREHRHEAGAWFNNRGETTIWENYVHLGEGFTLSLLAIELDAQ